MSMRKTIAVGGFQHETNTFAPHRAPFAAFERADSWPALSAGAELFDVMAGLNIPLAGFIDAAQAAGHELRPMCWCSAEPSSYVTRDAFDRITNLFRAALEAAAPPDAIYLDLHGAMVCEHLQDGEGALLRRLRELVGDDIPIVVSLDLHANISGEMLALSDAMAVYRTYPHLDMAATGARALELLESAAAGGNWHKSMLKLPFLIPLPSQCTDFEPCRSIYRELVDLSARPGVASVDFAAGFAPADIAECGPAIVAYGAREAAETAARNLYQRILEAEPQFRCELLDADTAVAQAIQDPSSKPVVLADAQDNPGAGATSDTTGLLEALVRLRAQRAAMALMYDPQAAAAAHAAGVGARLELALGGKSGFAGVEPFQREFAVEALGDGRFVFTGAMNLNAKAELGQMALLRVVDEHADVRVVVGSTRAQCLDQAIFRHLGIEPATQKIVAVKSTVHFRADFDPLAAVTLVVKAPGANYCLPTEMKYQNLRAGIRLEPLGPVRSG